MENKALNNRLIIISIFVFLFFSALTLKLVNVQIINKDKYKKSLDDIKVDEVYSTSTPRGRIFDRNYNLLVDNVGVKTIYYKRKPETSTKTQIELAYKMADKIDLDYSKLAKTNLKEFYLVNNKDTFVRWRYCYEHQGLSADFTFVKELSNALGSIVIQLHGEL